jgi:ATP-dependent Clp protease protease subunit
MDLGYCLLEERIIFLTSSIGDDLAYSIISQLLVLDGSSKSDIRLLINSPGGSISAGMGIYDTMQAVESDIITVCVGLATSMAALLLAAGTQGKRYSLPNSRIMIHQPIGGTASSQKDLTIQREEINYHKENLNKILAYHTSQPLQKIEVDTEKDFFMSAKEAMHYGLIDDVITRFPA